MAKVLLVEPYDAGSHRSWVVGVATRSAHDVRLVTHHRSELFGALPASRRPFADRLVHIGTASDEDGELPTAALLRTLGDREARQRDATIARRHVERVSGPELIGTYDELLEAVASRRAPAPAPS